MVRLQGGDNKLGLAAGVASLVTYVLVLRFVTGPADTLRWIFAYAILWGFYLAIFLPDRADGFVASPWVLLGWAAVARLVLAGGEPWLSDDLWRYLLDGHVFLEGINPYRFAPSDPVIRELLPGLSALVNHPDVPTIYPPVVQFVGWAAAAVNLSATGWRIMMSAVDLSVMVLVARLFGGGPSGWRAAAVYGLCPLAIFETGSNGHLEALAALPLVFAVRSMSGRRPWRAGIAFGLAILVKYYALLLLPLWWRRQGFRRAAASAAVVVVAGTLPFLLSGADPFAGLRTYLANWSFNSPVYSLLNGTLLPDLLVRAAPFAVTVIAATVAGFRRTDPVRAIPMLLFGFLVIGPTLHPWYALWVLPWLGGRPHPGLWSFVGSMGGAYLVWWSVAQSGIWELPPGTAEILWAIVAAGWLWSFWKEPGQTAAPV